MGQLAIRLIEATDDFEVHAALDSRSPLSDMIGADIVFDVSVPGASQAVVEAAIANGITAIVGTSGWSRDRIVALGPSLGAEPAIGLLFISNFSIGSVLATSLAALAAPSSTRSRSSKPTTRASSTRRRALPCARRS